MNGHLAHNVPTYVIGFSEALTEVEDEARLEAIAKDTGGKYYTLTDSSRLQAVMNSVGAELTCQAPPRTFTDELGQGKGAAHTVPISAARRKVQIAVSWASPLDKFTLKGLRLLVRGKPVAVAGRPGQGRKPRKLRVSRRDSSTYSLIEVAGLSRGELRFKVRADTIGSGMPQATVTTQVSR